MARPTNVFEEQEGMYTDGVQTPVTDLRQGASMGYAPDIASWVSHQPYTSRPLIVYLLEAPLAFNKLPNGNRYIAALRHMVEAMPMTVEGLNSRLDVTTDDSTPFGAGGQKHEVFTNVMEVAPDINFQWRERLGKGIYRFLSQWIRLTMMDPNTKYATANTIEGVELTDALPDQYSMSCLFIEPDPLHRTVVQSWVVTNMFPKTTGDSTGKRDLANPAAVVDIQVPFAGIAQFGAGVDAFAQKVLSTNSLIGADPHRRKSYVDEISARVADQDFGYDKSKQTLIDQQV